jgi:hypothetical protein
LLLALPAVAACAAQPLDPGAEPSEPPTAVEADALSSIDCSESQDTGYKSGTPFPITVVTVDGKKVEKDTANAYYVMAEAASAAGVNLKVVSGFRTMAEQQYLYDCYVNCNCNNCNLAAKPGYSNHQSGHALDLNTSSPGVLAWLNANGGAFGFSRTVPSEDWHWEWWGGGPGGGPCGGVPKGYLDLASCDVIAGWAQDPDDATGAIDVHVYFDGPAGAPSAIAVPTTANRHREDLCGPLGSCEHGFSLLAPYGLFDGQPHEVHAYGINVGSGGNAELADSPKTLDCAPKPLSGHRRHVIDPASWTAWAFSDTFDLMPASDAEIAALGAGDDWPAQPLLVVAEGDGAVYLVDGTHKRHVPNPDAMDAWHFSWSAIQTWSSDQVAALVEGPALEQRPLLVRETSGAVYVVDALGPSSPEPSGSAGSAGTAGASGSEGGSTSAGGSGSWGSSGSIGKSGSAKDGQARGGNGAVEGSCALGRSPPDTSAAIGWFLIGLAVARARHLRRARLG